MRTIFRKISVKERLPEDKKGHYYILKDGSFADKPKFYIYKEQIKIINRTCDYWIEEIKLPTEEDLINEFGIELTESSQANKYYNKTLKGKYEGAKWVLDFILSTIS